MTCVMQFYGKVKALLKIGKFLSINPDFIFINYRIMYNCAGRAIGEIMFTCAIMQHLLVIICW